ncbi:hypothetical protein J6590_040520 [Homalodisca vitripennis]|nr:hypothetical protein J6590_040520 [Homalodisca vitripennis]
MYELPTDFSRSLQEQDLFEKLRTLASPFFREGFKPQIMPLTGRYHEIKTKHGKCTSKHITHYRGTLTSEGNPVTNSDRVKAPVVGAGSTDFGGSQMYDVANQAGVTGVDHLAPCMPTITSEAEGMKLSVTSEEALLRTLTDKINRLLKAMARGTIRAMKDFVKVRHTIAKKSIACVDRTCQTSPFGIVYLENLPRLAPGRTLPLSR